MFWKKLKALAHDWCWVIVLGCVALALFLLALLQFLGVTEWPTWWFTTCVIFCPIFGAGAVLAGPYMDIAPDGD